MKRSRRTLAAAAAATGTLAGAGMVTGAIARPLDQPRQAATASLTAAAAEAVGPQALLLQRERAQLALRMAGLGSALSATRAELADRLARSTAIATAQGAQPVSAVAASRAGGREPAGSGTAVGGRASTPTPTPLIRRPVRPAPVVARSAPPVHAVTGASGAGGSPAYGGGDDSGSGHHDG